MSQTLYFMAYAKTYDELLRDRPKTILPIATLAVDDRRNIHQFIDLSCYTDQLSLTATESINDYPVLKFKLKPLPEGTKVIHPNSGEETYFDDYGCPPTCCEAELFQEMAIPSDNTRITIAIKAYMAALPKDFLVVVFLD